MATDELRDLLASIPGAAPARARNDGLWMDAPLLDIEAMARVMTEAGFRLATMTGVPRNDGETTVIYHFIRRGDAIHCKAVSRNGAMPSLAPTLRPASWIERELHDFFAVTFIGHPNLVPLLRPPGLQEGFFRDPAPAEA
ncbi:MAG TPA: NADH-quinone oxidoreductase subunit C [Acetobacteraceae bacterium]|nr:NADH-quinone oxidoreductase subunit C [Acetobacteraceae bacterium]